MDKDISYLIVNRLIDDMLGRYHIDAVIVKVRERDDVNIRVSMYEKWRELVSIELHKQGLIQEAYTGKRIEELEKMSLYDILELRDSYIKPQEEDCDEGTLV